MFMFMFMTVINIFHLTSLTPNPSLSPSSSSSLLFHHIFYISTKWQVATKLQVKEGACCNAARLVAMLQGLLQCCKACCNAARLVAMLQGLLQCCKACCNASRLVTMIQGLWQCSKACCNSARLVAMLQGLLQYCKVCNNAARGWVCGATSPLQEL